MKIDDSREIDKDDLEQLIDSMKKRDEEMFCLMKYTRQDDIRIKVKTKNSFEKSYLIILKGLTTELEQYSEKSIQLKRATEEEIIEYTGFQVELDKIAETFRRSHKQRQQLIKRWETILEQMQRKDHNIDQFSIVYLSKLFKSIE